MATQTIQHPMQLPDADLEQLLTERYKISYRLVMLFYRLGRRLRGQSSVADGAALAITVDQGRQSLAG